MISLSPMRLYLVRHANAGSRLAGGRDVHRPLSPRGWDRAGALVDLFAGLGVDRLVSSPATRCQQTLGPLSGATGLPIEECPALWEESSTLDTIDALERLDGQRIVACSHGNVIPALLEQLGLRGMTISGRGCELGSVWVVERDRDRGCWTRARHVGPQSPTLD